MRRVTTAVLGLLLGVSLAAACDDGVGKVCEKDSDCAEGLICDVHDGQGTCQEEHGHETDSGESTETDTDGHEHAHTESDTDTN
ncbi:MAG: hypothetical protein H6713_04835 [Myxococcales bacterium]|nr:hypothetical protein [Myxococcales bacterium]MCB9749318.1 hypothetical protein [Myxococcales bacterium]